MRISFSETQHNYLIAYIPESLQHLIHEFQETGVNTAFYLDVQNDVADEIRDWALERQDKVGFDIKYQLTSEGQLLQEIIDLFYQ
jgi:hypothetical protein